MHTNARNQSFETFRGFAPWRIGMRKAGISAARAAGLVLALGALAAGCAGDMGDVNYVQPGYVKKADLLQGSWYYRRTVVDAPEGFAEYATIGTGDLFTMERIRFEIEERYLIGYRAYEHVPGSEEGEQQGDEYRGHPVVMFPIAYHFDIARAYNTATGEESNVIMENTVDREWFDREFMRVGWNNTGLSRDDYFILPVDYLDQDGVEGGQFYMHENDVTSPWRARIQPEKGYLDFVSNHFAFPDIETCYYTYDIFNCGSGEIKVRHAFMRRNEEAARDFETLYYPDSVPVLDAQGKEIADPVTGEVKREPIFSRFGYYRLEKLTYDDLRGLTESGRLYRMLRFNIWEKSHDAAGQPLPHAQRAVKPIVYYLNWDFPADLVPAAIEVANEWNATFREMVASAQNKPIDQVPDVFILKTNSCNKDTLEQYLAAHSKVRDQAAAAVQNAPIDNDTLDNWCAATEFASGGEFVWQQIGDPRFNMMYWIPNVVPTSFSGYGPMLADPETGEIVAATAYIMGWTIESAATRALQYIDFMNGALPLEDLIAGNDVPAWVTEGDYDPRRHTFSMDEAQARARHEASAEHLRSLENRFQALGGTKERLLTRIDNGRHFDERLARIKGTSIEAEYLTRPEDLMLASRGAWHPGMPVTDELLEEASLVTRMRDGRLRRERTERFMQEHTFCNFAAELDNGLVGLAKELKDLPRDVRRTTLRERIFKAVMLHEVGHNVGLRHNFEASYDALNYNRTFWELETTHGSNETAKLDAKQPEYKYSSIMDYHGKVNADFQGLGLYDKAAIKFGYGQLLEKFDSNAGNAGKALRDWRFSNDYRKLPQHIGSVQAMYDRSDVRWDWMNEENRKESTLTTLLADEVPYLFCSDEYAGLTPTCKRFDFGANQREQMASNYIRYKNYFLFTNYLRNRLLLDFGSIVYRGYSIFRDVLMTYQYMYLYRAQDDNFLNTDLGKDMATAVADGFNLLSEVLAMPTPGTYYKCDEGGGGDQVYYPGGYIYFSPLVDPNVGTAIEGETCDMNATMKLQLGESEPLFLGFSEDFVEWTFTYLGTYWDKQSAIEVLTDPRAQFFRVNQVEDFRLYSVSPYRVYDREILNLMNGLIRYDRKALASRVDDSTPNSPRVVPRALVDSSQPLVDFENPPPPQSSTLPVVIPALARNLQRTALLYGTAFLTSPLDDTLDFAKHTRVWVKGAFDDVAAFDAVNPASRAECTMPDVGVTYRAIKVADASNISNIGFDMVNECAAFRTSYDTALGDLQTAQAALAAAISNDPNDPAIPDLQDDVRSAQVDVENAEFDLGVVQQMLQYTRIVHALYEHGIEL